MSWEDACSIYLIDTVAGWDPGIRADYNPVEMCEENHPDELGIECWHQAWEELELNPIKHTKNLLHFSRTGALVVWPLQYQNKFSHFKTSDWRNYADMRTCQLFCLNKAQILTFSYALSNFLPFSQFDIRIASLWASQFITIEYTNIHSLHDIQRKLVFCKA